MGFILSVGGIFNFSLENREILDFSFKYEVQKSGYAKGPLDTRLLKITGDITRTLETAPEAMGQIRRWVALRYKDPSYFHGAKIVYIYRDEVLRSYEFTHCFVKSYEEHINPHSGRGTYTLLLAQRVDMRHKVSIDGRPPRLTYSEMWAERDRVRAERVAQVQVASLTQNAVNDENTRRELRPPFWVNRAFLMPEMEIVGSNAAFHIGNGLEAARSNPPSGNLPIGYKFWPRNISYFSSSRWAEFASNAWIRIDENVNEHDSIEQGNRMKVRLQGPNYTPLEVIVYRPPHLPPEPRHLFWALNQHNDFLKIPPRNFNSLNGLIRNHISLGFPNWGLADGTIVTLGNRKHIVGAMNRNIVEVISWDIDTQLSIPRNLSQMMTNVLNDTTLRVESPERRISMVILGHEMLNLGYEPAFTAGMMANIMREGSFGQFEAANRNPTNNPAYMEHFVRYHDYFRQFQQRNIINFNLNDIYAMSLRRSHQSANIFGIGIAQWTHRERHLPLLQSYMELSSDGRITRENVIQVELERLISEIDGYNLNGHRGMVEVDRRVNMPWNTPDIRQYWRSQNPNGLNNVAAANSAAYLISSTLT